ncbi:general stress protein [Cellulomonas sp. PhB143]|uniref:general stress protein n=1 Tax=Cellulomonas sp. PhB143 TaxID=2485186 RepID=UPI000F493AA8|nr:general stress protein [Cellulomonas sp. PhB143]ROS76849.1 hypothetical protein EDF32_0833 [Cellulomonas sp. PhB143]
MSMSRPNTPLKVPTLPRGDVVATYTSYLEAQKAVDYLADSRFAVEYVTIVGSDLKMVERVIGRLTYGRVALAGVASGAWFGLFVGLLLVLFGSASGGSAGGLIVTAIALGAGFGLLFSVLTFAMSGRKRDFTSSSQIVASDYSILCAPERSGEARQVLGRMAAGVPAGQDGPGGPGQGAPQGQGPIPPYPPQGGGRPGQHGQPGPYGQPGQHGQYGQPPQAPPGGQAPGQHGTPPTWPTPPAQGAPVDTPVEGGGPQPERAPDPRFVTPSGAPRYGAMISDYPPAQATQDARAREAEAARRAQEPSSGARQTDGDAPADGEKPAERTEE